MINYLRKITALFAQGYKKHGNRLAHPLKKAKNKSLKYSKGAHKYVYNRQLAVNVRNFLVVFLIILIGVLLQTLVFVNGRYNQVRAEFYDRQEEYRYWTNVVQQYPTVPDVLYNASLSALRVGDKDEALGFIKKAINIDPLFEKAYLLQNEISNL